MSGLRESELVALGPCVICHRHLLEGALPLFYKIRISRHGFDRDAVMRGAGMAMAFGRLASVLGPDESLTKIICNDVDVAVHEECANNIAHLAQLFPDEEKIDG